MNNNDAPRPILTRIFVVFVGIQAALEFVIGAGMLVDFKLAVESGFGITHTNDMDLFGVVIGLQLVMLAILMVFSIIWTNRGQKSGPTVAIIAGVYSLIFGVMSFVKFGNVDAIYIDSIRGLITAILGFVIYNQFKGSGNK
ncbi:MAG: hypothetical protein ACJA1N_000112 [Saprospiraceae bacterium]|jgi:hypothetical protein|tara:strand:+ start:305 stop:727 length:423 start_codon:yes stop_codon:yes gene_type:complete